MVSYFQCDTIAGFMFLVSVDSLSFSGEVGIMISIEKHGLKMVQLN